MDQPRTDRRLAAILAADVAGYSRLMEADEEATLAQLKAHRRALIDSKIKEHRGQLVNLGAGPRQAAGSTANPKVSALSANLPVAFTTLVAISCMTGI
jgi:class 3 adenylate cyclase